MARLDSSKRGELPDRAFAYIDSRGRRRLPIHVMATGSSALRVTTGSRESLAGRFERVVLTHWSARSLGAAFDVPPSEAPAMLVRNGG
jgi:hypothetical protein